MTPILSNHASERMDERVGLAPKAARRHAAKALTEGIATAATRGPLRRWLNGRETDPKHHHCFCRIYGDHVFLFGRDSVLVTVLFLPHEFRGAVAKIKTRRA